MTFDVRVMLPVFILCCAGIVSMKPNWKTILFILGFMFIMAGVIGSVMVILVRPSSGLTRVGAETIIVRFNSRFFISRELLWFVGAMFFKRLCSLSTALFFIISITPSELAAGLNKIRLPYKICTVVSLAFRTIPDIARDYTDIKNSLMMRGVEMDARKIGLLKRLRQSTLALAPLIITSFGKVGNIATAMDLRRFGKLKQKTWYSEHEPEKADWIMRAVIILIALFCVFYIVFFRILNPPPFDYWSPWGLK
jgi:energy-coupling factor transport system permease protein